MSRPQEIRTASFCPGVQQQLPMRVTAFPATRASLSESLLESNLWLSPLQSRGRERLTWWAATPKRDQFRTCKHHGRLTGSSWSRDLGDSGSEKDEMRRKGRFVLSGDCRRWLSACRMEEFPSGQSNIGHHGEELPVARVMQGAGLLVQSGDWASSPARSFSKPSPHHGTQGHTWVLTPPSGLSVTWAPPPLSFHGPASSPGSILKPRESSQVLRPLCIRP